MTSGPLYWQYWWGAVSNKSRQQSVNNRTRGTQKSNMLGVRRAHIFLPICLSCVFARKLVTEKQAARLQSVFIWYWVEAASQTGLDWQESSQVCHCGKIKMNLKINYDWKCVMHLQFGFDSFVLLSLWGSMWQTYFCMLCFLIQHEEMRDEWTKPLQRLKSCGLGCDSSGWRALVESLTDIW